MDSETAAMWEFRADVGDQWKRDTAVRHMHDQLGITEPDPDDPTFWALFVLGGAYEDRLDQLVEQTAAELRAAGFQPASLQPA